MTVRGGRSIRRLSIEQKLKRYPITYKDSYQRITPFSGKLESCTMHSGMGAGFRDLCPTAGSVAAKATRE
jgi:hypothetical protein